MQPRIEEAMTDTPVVLVAGPRQAGKTTLVRQVAGHGMRYLTLDDELTRLSARDDPQGMVRGLDRAVIDEVQRAPQLLLAIKRSVDEDRRPGRFLLTGSADVMSLPKVADSLAGRLESLRLLPLAQGEIEGRAVNWLDHVFAGRIPRPGSSARSSDLPGRVLRGGYPQALARPTARRRTAWARQYLDALLQRDVRDISGIEKLAQLPRFLRALAQTAGQMCNYTQLAGQVGLDSKTASRYIGVLEQMVLLERVQAWSGNRLSRLVKSPKLQFIDSGLLATLLDLNEARLEQGRTPFGQLLETFVYGELLKHASWAEGDYRLMYYRDADKFEVDIVIEDSAGGLVGVEVKASATVRQSDLRGLRKLASVSGEAFRMGILLHDGEETLPLGPGFWAAPVSTLWGSVPGPDE
jgi:predicted AAA+ superfamily ATPase